MDCQVIGDINRNTVDEPLRVCCYGQVCLHDAVINEISIFNEKCPSFFHLEKQFGPAAFSLNKRMNKPTYKAFLKREGD